MTIRSDPSERRSRAPLFVNGVQDDAHHAETLERPVQQPGLAGILAGVACWEALYEVSDEKLEVLLPLEGWRVLGIEREMFEEDRLCFRLGVRGLCGVLIVC